MKSSWFFLTILVSGNLVLNWLLIVKVVTKYEIVNLVIDAGGLSEIVPVQVELPFIVSVFLLTGLVGLVRNYIVGLVHGIFFEGQVLWKQNATLIHYSAV